MGIPSAGCCVERFAQASRVSAAKPISEVEWDLVSEVE
jgi:hypothetical protein